jgi:hypothetical protein
LTSYYTTLHIKTDNRVDYLRLPKFFKSITQIDLIDIDTKTTVNPINSDEQETYFHFDFLDNKLISSEVKIRII